MLTIGICNDETSSACLFKNGELIAAVSEERFSRKKMDNSFPIMSIKYLLSLTEKKLEEINIAYSWAKGFNPELIKYYFQRYDLCLEGNDKNIFKERINHDIKRDQKGLNKMIKWQKNNFNNSTFDHFYHHEGHAASCSLLSEFNDGICLTVDGVGDFESLSIWKFTRLDREKPLKKIFSSTTSDSLGYFYGRITGLLGFQPMKHEGKITGLAAFGDPHNALPLMKRMIDFKSGKIISNLGELYKPYFKPYSKKLIEEINKFKKEDIAAAAQEHIENLLIKLITFTLKKHNIINTNLMCAGGVFGNVKITQKLKSLPIINNIFVQPHMGDGGLCLGAAALSQHLKGEDIKPMKNTYLGPKVDLNKFLKHCSCDKKLNLEKHENTIEEICKDLKSNLVVALVRGRMEFGPRALCHRSILYKTSDKGINKHINDRLSRTEFMPFAPVIREENAFKAFEGYESSDSTLEFMTSTIDCTNYFKTLSPAVVHIDQTARPQIIKKKKDQFMWDLLKRWEEISKEISLVNTSFNAHEEPIICDFQDAIKALKDKRVDVLYIENYRVVLVD